jgi:hypothetical protein
MRRYLLAPALALLVGCGDSNGITEPPPATLTGEWTFSAPALIAGTMSCEISGMVLTLSQTGDDVTGASQGGTITCRDGQTSNSRELSAFVVEGSEMEGDVELSIGPALTVVGTFTGSAITGTATIQDVFGPQYTGAFTATRR